MHCHAPSPQDRTPCSTVYDSVDSVEDILGAISKWDFNDSDNAIYYYTKITTLQNVLYGMEEE